MSTPKLEAYETKHLSSVKEADNFRTNLRFTSSEAFCMGRKRVFCSKKMNEESRRLAVQRLKFMASIMVIVDHVATHMKDFPFERDYDLSNGEDVMALSGHFSYTQQHWFLLAMELHADRCFDESVKLI
jgi:hypothetical protein